jgi:hypothetical protein
MESLCPEVNFRETVFFRYFYEQNKLIKKGDIQGVELDLKTLGIGNGIIDAETQFPHVSRTAVFPPQQRTFTR